MWERCKGERGEEEGGKGGRSGCRMYTGMKFLTMVYHKFITPVTTLCVVLFFSS